MRMKKQNSVFLAENEKANTQLWGRRNEERGIFEDIELFIEECSYKPGWSHLDHPSFPPEILFEDINGDGVDEIIILLNKGSGSGVSIWEIHILEESEECGYSQVFVEDPESHLHVNMESSITPYTGRIHYFSKYQTETWDVPFSWGYQEDHLFDEFVIGSQIRFKVENGNLVAFAGIQLSFLCHIGELQLQYCYKQGKYLIKTAQLHVWE